MSNPLPDFVIRSATEKDRQLLANLIHYESHVHRHLDWRPPLEWIGYHPYLLAEINSNVVAALACPPDPPGVAWIRLFAIASQVTPGQAWDRLWQQARSMLSSGLTQVKVAVIPLQFWFRDLLGQSEFAFTHEVVVLAWKGEKLPRAPRLPGVLIRPMRKNDLSEVVRVDWSAFADIWRNSLPCLETAFNQSVVATVAEASGRLIGYQISSAAAASGHLARLAVSPDFQGRGIGYAIVCDLLERFEERGTFHVTVNTQHNNLSSLALYKKAGFRLTGEVYPVYEQQIATGV
jgi:[ribosomal protein S18]-alanine N-acetyltransferase